MWERTAVQCLQRNKQSGAYYGRFTLHGKQKWYPLEADVPSVAKLRLPDKAAEMARLRGSLMNVEAGRGMMSDLMEVYVARTKGDADLRPASITGRLVSLKKLQKIWPGIEAMAPKQINAAIADLRIEIPRIPGDIQHGVGNCRPLPVDQVTRQVHVDAARARVLRAQFDSDFPNIAEHGLHLGDPPKRLGQGGPAAGGVADDAVDFDGGARGAVLRGEVLDPGHAGVFVKRAAAALTSGARTQTLIAISTRTVAKLIARNSAVMRQPVSSATVGPVGRHAFHVFAGTRCGRPALPPPGHAGPGPAACPAAGLF